MRAIALFSGGLDSMLAIKIIEQQDIDVIAVYIDIGFDSKDKKESLKKAALDAGATDYIHFDASVDFLENILPKPVFGYGKAINPCIDCHAFMVKQAITLMEKHDASFVITGEVVGQRPMSQKKQAMRSVESLANSDNILLRPLCAKFFPPTLLEINGWIDREKLLDIQGRGRGRQLELAKYYNLKNFAPPAGGCMLTEPLFGAKVKDAMRYGEIKTNDAKLLLIGRHFRLPNGAKLVLGRNFDDEQKLRNLSHESFEEIFATKLSGPFGMIEKNISEDDTKIAMKILLSYISKASFDNLHEIQIGNSIYYSTNNMKRNESLIYCPG